MGNTKESAQRIAEDRKLLLMANQPKTFLKIGVQPGDVVTYRNWPLSLWADKNRKAHACWRRHARAIDVQTYSKHFT